MESRERGIRIGLRGPLLTPQNQGHKLQIRVHVISARFPVLIIVNRSPPSGPGEMESPTSMTVGPVEYLLLSYREGRLGADVTTEAWRLVTSGTIRILDLALIKRTSTAILRCRSMTDQEGWPSSPASLRRSRDCSTRRTSPTEWSYGARKLCGPCPVWEIPGHDLSLLGCGCRSCLAAGWESWRRYRRGRGSVGIGSRG